MAKVSTEVTSEDKIVSIDSLIENDINPRKIQQKAFIALKKSLQEFPEMKKLRMIVVDEDLKILGGHQRIYALKDLGYTDVEVKQVFGLSEKQKREFIIKDNTASGEWDTDILANNWEMDELEDWGLNNFNFGDVDKEPKEPASKDDQSKTHVCPNCEFEFED
jgi:ParB-like chromosome segregation protein Spo0J